MTSCRICLEEDGEFVHPCACKGSNGVHSQCLMKWIEESKKKYCEICKQEYNMQEYSSCNTKRTCKHMLSMTVDFDDTQYKRISGMIFILSIMGLMFVQSDYLILASAISTILIGILVFYTAVLYHGNTMMLYNAAVIWKSAFSIPYSILIFILYLTVSDECYVECVTIHETCDASCPTYINYYHQKQNLIRLLLYDWSITLTVLFIRCAMVCYFHMRNLKFQDFDPEKESLLPNNSSDESASSSDSSSGASSSSSSSDSSASSSASAPGSFVETV